MLLQRTNFGVGEQRRKSAVIRPGFWCLSAGGASILLGSCSTLLTARVLGPALFGQYAFALWIALVAAPAAGVGMSPLTSQAMSTIQSREKPQIAAGIFFFVLLQHYRKMALYCLLYLLFIIPCLWFLGSSVSLMFLLIVGLSIPLLLSGGLMSITLRSLHRFDLLAAIQLLGMSVTLLLVLLSLQAKIQPMERVYMLLFVPAISAIVKLLVAFLCIVKLLPLKEAREPSSELKQQLIRGSRSPLLFFLLDAIVWQHAELIVLGHGHTADTAFYLVCVLISTRAVQAIPTLYTTCILPPLLTIMPGRRSINTSRAFRQSTRDLLLLTIPGCAACIIFCPTLIEWCFGSAYLPLVTPLRILLVAAAAGSISSASITWLAHKECHKERRRAQILLGATSAALTILLAVPLIALDGMTGAALASACAQCVFATGSIVLCSRTIRSRKTS